jgi:hypothetical protein
MGAVNNQNPYTFMIQFTGLRGSNLEIFSWTNISISNGDMLPSFDNGTDFGSIDAPSDAQDKQRVFTIINSGDAPLEFGISPVTIGNNNFIIKTQPFPLSILQPGDSTIFVICPNPKTIGVLQTTVSITNIYI